MSCLTKIIESFLPILKGRKRSADIELAKRNQTSLTHA